MALPQNCKQIPGSGMMPGTPGNREFTFYSLLHCLFVHQFHFFLVNICFVFVYFFFSLSLKIGPHLNNSVMLLWLKSFWALALFYLFLIFQLFSFCFLNVIWKKKKKRIAWNVCVCERRRFLCNGINSSSVERMHRFWWNKNTIFLYRANYFKMNRVAKINQHTFSSHTFHGINANLLWENAKCFCIPNLIFFLFLLNVIRIIAFWFMFKQNLARLVSHKQKKSCSKQCYCTKKKLILYVYQLLFCYALMTKPKGTVFCMWRFLVVLIIFSLSKHCFNFCISIPILITNYI